MSIFDSQLTERTVFSFLEVHPMTISAKFAIEMYNSFR
jgi:hypothetical protein